MSVFERLLTLLVASDGTSHRRGLGPALGECRRRKGPDSCPQQLCAGYIRVAKISSQQEARCGAYHRNGAAEKVAGDHSVCGRPRLCFRLRTPPWEIATGSKHVGRRPPQTRSRKGDYHSQKSQVWIPQFTARPIVLILWRMAPIRRPFRT